MHVRILAEKETCDKTLILALLRIYISMESVIQVKSQPYLK